MIMRIVVAGICFIGFDLLSHEGEPQADAQGVGLPQIRCPHCGKNFEFAPTVQDRASTFSEIERRGYEQGVHDTEEIAIKRDLGAWCTSTTTFLLARNKLNQVTWPGYSMVIYPYDEDDVSYILDMPHEIGFRADGVVVWRIREGLDE